MGCHLFTTTPWAPQGSFPLQEPYQGLCSKSGHSWTSPDGHYSQVSRNINGALSAVTGEREEDQTRRQKQLPPHDTDSDMEICLQEVHGVCFGDRHLWSVKESDLRRGRSQALMHSQQGRQSIPQWVLRLGWLLGVAPNGTWPLCPCIKQSLNVGCAWGGA